MIEQSKDATSTAIKLYDDKSEIHIPLKISVEPPINQTLAIMEFIEVPYSELLSYATKNALLYNQYDTQGRPLAFLSWYDNHLFFYSPVNTTVDYVGQKFPDYYMNFFYYTKFGPYKDVLLETVFDEKVKICVDRTSRPILIQIIEYINKANVKKKP